MAYLAAALALVSASAQHSGAAVERLKAFETEHGRALPAAVREWYSLAEARTILEPSDNGDHVYAVDELGGSATYYWPGDDDEWPEDLDEQEERHFDPVAMGLLPFLEENQGVYCLAVRLDGSDDPPVVLSWDGVQPDTWQPHASRFSEWVHTRVWDLPLLRGSGTLKGGLKEVTAADLEVLARRLRERPSTTTDSPSPGPAQVWRRFAGTDAGDDQRVLLLSPHTDGGTWTVYFWAASDDLLVDLVTAVRSVLTLHGDLTPAHGPDDVAERALERLNS
ncbi:SMI1/KNR4 family protein [Streptomyces coeruleoprunus]|uniref:SMI1/KNR4 family protein n=1 Tax=Streptomyces coeruleoprunus TaxID=285563 RepID=A0ABV9XB77_9ACTN